MSSIFNQIKMLVSTMKESGINIIPNFFTLSIFENIISFLDIKYRKTSFTSIIIRESEVKFIMADKFIITIHADDELTVVNNGVKVELNDIEKEYVFNSIKLCINLIEKSIQEYRMPNNKNQVKEELFKLLLSPDAIQEVLAELY